MATPPGGDPPGETPGKDKSPANDPTHTASVEIQVTGPTKARVTTLDEGAVRTYLNPPR